MICDICKHEMKEEDEDSTDKEIAKDLKTAKDSARLYLIYSRGVKKERRECTGDHESFHDYVRRTGGLPDHFA